MTTLLLYLLIMAVVVAVVFAVVWFVFGRGEDLPPIDDATTLTRLPRSAINGYDVRALTFELTLRGYKQSDVDWALARLADEIDDLRALVQQLQDRAASTPGGVGPVGWTGRHESDDTAIDAAAVDVPAVDVPAVDVPAVDVPGADGAEEPDAEHEHDHDANDDGGSDALGVPPRVDP